ncbi:MFS transporter [Photorhabdus khanii]|uniref:MFS transporter n=1 Tax=Photorhabdus khanii subsp. guanajuatensis TaxID=2100166 RepID=A0A4R4K4B2_9GAMM|nr:MFS transporter [Photorhabdus khanii]TDB62254.1 MFS transporter [Photorhabdus khanii subsp. guanajuatensis]
MKQNTSGFLGRIGMPSTLSWGYLGILAFMIGNGIEIGWLSPYLVDNGLSIQDVSTLFSIYGISVAISSWFAGVFFEAFGAKRTMLLGTIFCVVGTVGFVSLGLKEMSYPLLLIAQAIKGFGYPLFAYSFSVWIAYRSPVVKLSTAYGWFYFVFSGGMQVLATFYASWAVEELGHINTLWTTLIFIIVGAFFALVLNRDNIKPQSNNNTRENIKEVLKGITILKEYPKLFISCILRIINSLSQYAFPVYLPVYMISQGFTTTQWLSIWGTAFTSNILFNLVWGIAGDKIGYKRTIIWCGGVLTGVASLLLFFAPQFVGTNYAIVLICGICWGAGVAGYIPLDAMSANMVEKDKGAVMSVLNLGTGLSVVIGPAIVGLFINSLGASGVTCIVATLYFFGALITNFLDEPEKVSKTIIQSDAITMNKFPNS